MTTTCSETFSALSFEPSPVACMAREMALVILPASNATIRPSLFRTCSKELFFVMVYPL